ncbi:hypothetical protein K474DRAFT_1662242 [Panus rudis PR-1116 ss-1]|nr:hypothetical protein K474DRAFT_1662242 [Panus rudis PR-1116 ss-1]
MSSFHLRPVADGPPSPSTSTSTGSDRTPPPPRDHKITILPPQANGPRRPLTPTSLRDVDLSGQRDAPPRKWPVPPTGHELMALFPPAPPLTIMSGPTSGFFQQQERAFFAQAGKEIVRVRIEVDLPQNAETEDGHSHQPHIHKPPTRTHSSSNASQHQQLQQHDRTSGWTPTSQPPPPPPHHLAYSHSHAHSSPSLSPPIARSLPPVNFADAQRPSRSGPVPLTVQPVYPAQSVISSSTSRAPGPPPPGPPPPPSMPPPHNTTNTHAHHRYIPGRSPTEEHPRSPHAHPSIAGDEYRNDDPDEAWRRPMPHNQRRRAGKHTKRVVVR